MKYTFSLIIGCALTMTSCSLEGKEKLAQNETEPTNSHKQEVKQGQPLMRWADLTSRVLPEPDHTISYGEGPSQVADLWVPQGTGPHPVVIMIHGGCWQKAIADRTLMNYAAEEMKNNGIAVWNIEYRGVDEEGGGYPGTFLDVADAASKLKGVGGEYSLNTEKIDVFGHSAGGHLGVWLAARNGISANSPLASGPIIDVNLVINSGGLADLEASKPVTLDTCLANIYDKLTGPATDQRPDVLSDTSPSELLPFSAKIISVNGSNDGIAPPILGQDLTRKIIAAGGHGESVVIGNTGHVELISPGTEAFTKQIKLLREAQK